MDGANMPATVKTERDLRLPPELDEGFPVTFARLRRHFRAKGIPTEEAADLAQETIARTLLHLRRRGQLLEDGSRPDGLDPLMKRIATNLLIDRARAISPTLLPIEGAEDVHDARPDPSDEVERRQQRAQVHHAINELASRHRTAMLLSLEGLTPAEIAEHMGIQRNAADAVLYRARRSLARSLASVAGLIKGLAIVVAFKVRDAGRRASELSRLGEQMIAAQTIMGITAATIGATLTMSTPAVGQPARDDRRVVPVEAAASIEPDAGARSSSTDPASSGDARLGGGVGSLQPSASMDARRHQMSAEASVPDGDEEKDVELDLWHERHDDDRGTAGPLMDEATDAACAATGTCDL